MNAWYMGLILYQIIENRQPFTYSNDDLIGKARGQTETEIAGLLSQEYKLQFQEAESCPELVDLLKKLLKPNPKDRLKFAVVIIHPFIKKFPIPPHVYGHPPRFCQLLSSPAPLQKSSSNSISKSSSLMNDNAAMRTCETIIGGCQPPLWKTD